MLVLKLKLMIHTLNYCTAMERLGILLMLSACVALTLPHQSKSFPTSSCPGCPSINKFVEIRSKGGLCPGGIAGKDFIATTAHCALLPTTAYNVTAGDGQVKRVTRIVVHKSFQGGWDHDIAVMKVSPPFTMNGHVEPMKVPEDIRKMPRPFSQHGEWIKEMTTIRAQDSRPILSITKCSGFHEGTSGVITLTKLKAGQKCIFVVKSIYDTVTIKATRSTLLPEDRLLINRFVGSMPTRGAYMDQVGNDLPGPGGYLVYILSISDKQPDHLRSIRMEFYDSGYLEPVSYSGINMVNTSTPGSFAYPPNGGNHQLNEDALIFLGPSQLEGYENKTLTFPHINLEEPVFGYCRTDYVTVWIWKDNHFRDVARVCGTTPPPPVVIPGGVAVLTFTTDNYVNRQGFTVSYA